MDGLTESLDQRLHRYALVALMDNNQFGKIRSDIVYAMMFGIT